MLFLTITFLHKICLKIKLWNIKLMPGGRESKLRNICSMSSRLLVRSTYLCHKRRMVLLFCVYASAFFQQKLLGFFICFVVGFWLVVWGVGVFVFLFYSLFFFLKQCLETIGKHSIFRRWDSAVQRIQMLWRHMPANSKILLDIMKATLASLKSLYNRQRIKTASSMQNKCARRVKEWCLKGT